MALPSFRTAAVLAVLSTTLLPLSGLNVVRAESSAPENLSPDGGAAQDGTGKAPESGAGAGESSAEAGEPTPGGEGSGASSEDEAQAEAAPAQESVDPQSLADLTTTLQISDVLAVMSEEGQAYGASLEEQMFPGKGGLGWEAQVAAIYEPQDLMPVFSRAFEAALAHDSEAVAAAQAFFATKQGQEILRLEVEARRALLDIAVEEAAQVEAERMKTERDPKLRLIRDLIEAGDLIESNVAGALTANLAFYEGMAEVGVAGMPSDLEAIMSEVWGQEEGIRSETANWLVPYLAMAYQPLPEADLKPYVAFSRSPEGKRLNAALFAGFEAVSRQVSFNLGRAAARVMAGSDI